MFLKGYKINEKSQTNLILNSKCLQKLIIKPIVYLINLLIKINNRFFLLKFY